MRERNSRTACLTPTFAEDPSCCRRCRSVPSANARRALGTGRLRSRCARWWPWPQRPRPRSPSSSTTTSHSITTSSLRLPHEIDALDSGRIVGWGRTGFVFDGYATPGGAQGAVVNPVCRFYHSAGARRLALSFGVAGGMRRGPREGIDRSELQRLPRGNVGGVLHRAAEHRHRRMSGGNRTRVPAVEPACRLESPLHGRSRTARRDDRAGLRGGGLRPARRRDVHDARRRRGLAGAGDGAVAVCARLRRRSGDGHRLRRRRSGTVHCNRSAERVAPDRRIPAGSLVGWRRTRPAHRLLVRRRSHVVADAGQILSLHRWQRREWRRLRARERSVGDDRTRRHRVPDRHRVQW